MADDSTFDPELTEVEAILRELDADVLKLESPPPGVWAGIVAQLGDVRRGGDVTTADVQAPVVPHRRPRAWMVPTMVAAAVVLVAVSAVALITRDGSESTTLATADLAFDPAEFDPAGENAAATAVLLDDGGNEVLEIDAVSLPFDIDEDASLELWMIRVEGGEIVGMVSLGDIDEDGTRDFAVPAGYDPTVYSVVDISVEPHDGDSTHSGRSILRGELGPV